VPIRSAQGVKKTGLNCSILVWGGGKKNKGKLEGSGGDVGFLLVAANLSDCGNGSAAQRKASDGANREAKGKRKQLASSQKEPRRQMRHKRRGDGRGVKGRNSRKRRLRKPWGKIGLNKVTLNSGPIQNIRTPGKKRVATRDKNTRKDYVSRNRHGKAGR